MSRKALCKEVVSPLCECFNRYYIILGTFFLPSIIKSECVEEVLIETIVRNIRVNRITVKACRRFDMFKTGFM